jgi:hypothetical protein
VRGAVCLLLGLLSTAGTAARIDGLAVSRDGDSYTLVLNARLSVPRDAAWRALTDYPNLHRLSEAVLQSRELPPDGAGGHLVYTFSHVCVWIFCKDLAHLQRVSEMGPGRLEADSVPEGSDFVRGFTRWVLTPRDGGTDFEFSTRLVPDFWVPPLLGPYLIQSGLRSTALDALQGLERAAASQP